MLLVDKDVVMVWFVVGDIKVLVLIMVIEVGVNVFNVLIMVIECVENFGLV